jgi:hypothetical protein
MKFISRSERFAVVGVRTFSHPALLSRLSSLFLVFAALACGVGRFAAAQENVPKSPRYVRTPSGSLLAVPAGHELTASASTKAQAASTSASGPLIYTIAGGGTGGYSGDGGPATEAGLTTPQSVAVDNAGNVYIADGYDYVVRKIAAATGIINTVVGTGTAGYSGDGGPATSAQIGEAQDVEISLALDASGNLYIADTANNVIREVSASTGVITTIAGTGTEGGGRRWRSRYQRQFACTQAN